MNGNEWIKIGEIGVDAGLCWIGDPCYILKEEETGLEATGHKTWAAFCDGIFGEEYPTIKQYNYSPGNPGLGVCVSTGFGDGGYDVLAKITDEGEWGRRVAEVKVVFIPNEIKQSRPPTPVQEQQ